MAANNEPIIWVLHPNTGGWESFSGPFADVPTAVSELSGFGVDLLKMYDGWCISVESPDA